MNGSINNKNKLNMDLIDISKKMKIMICLYFVCLWECSFFAFAIFPSFNERLLVDSLFVDITIGLFILSVCDLLLYPVLYRA